MESLKTEKNVNDKASIARSKFNEGYNCTQAIVYSFADEMGIDRDLLLTLALGFGVGMGRKQEVCGAISGAVMVIGAIYGKQNSKDNSQTYRNIQLLIDGFTEEKGSIKCLDLLSGCNLLTDEGQCEFKEKKLRSRCESYIELVCHILQKDFIYKEAENNRIKEMVKQRYSELALNSNELKSDSCCDTTPAVQSNKSNSGCCTVPAAPSNKVFSIMSEDYSKLKGYEPDADLGAGCGLPTQYAGIREGDTVVDLGSGAGNDCFIAREEVGETGRIIGIDFSHGMIEKARKNTAKRGFKNIEFIEGDIENIPLPGSSVDVVVSNCVLNLLPQKDKIFKEIYRVLKPEAHFCVSDVVLNGVFPQAFTDNAAMYVGCIASAIQIDDYIEEIKKAGFKFIEVKQTKTIILPDDFLHEHLDEATIQKYKTENVGVVSITVTGQKSLS